MMSPITTSVWRFPVDRHTRRHYFCEEAFSHPAKLHLGLLQRLLDMYTVPGETILDPMAGTGSLMIAATQQRNVILRDIQPEYVDLMSRSVSIIHHRAGLFGGLIDIDCGDARTLECPPFDSIICSPPYGFETGAGVSNPRRIALMYQGELGKRWRRYLETPTHASVAAGFRYLGGQDNIGNKSGRNYWRDMQCIYERMVALLPAGGRLILILKNHYRRGRLIDVTGQTICVVQTLGLELAARHQRVVSPLSLWQRRRKEKGLPVIEVEDVLVFVKGSAV